MHVFSILVLITAPIIVLDFIAYLAGDNRFLKGGLGLIFEILTVVIYPLSYLMLVDYNQPNDCCKANSLFSPAHRTTIYFIIFLCMVAFFYSGLKKKIGPPLLELLANCLLILGIILNFVLLIHESHDLPIEILGYPPIIILFIHRVIGNHKMIVYSVKMKSIANPKSFVWKILSQPILKKIPLLLVLCAPVMLIIVSVLLLVGQKPDSFIQAFTNTYKHGLSKLDCSNVTCPDGHFLCTVAASGHKSFVKPIRIGVRQDVVIKVNRQLLVSNAFEDLLAEKLPALHKCVRKIYNTIGGNCKKLYDLLDSRWLADMVYVFMKPVEWIFIISLYLFDKHPENRIAKQYLYSYHRKIIDEKIKNS